MSGFILVINALIYIGLFVMFLRKDRRVTLSLIVWGLYTFMSLLAISLYKDPISSYGDIKVFPLIYLLVMLVLSIYPLRVFEKKQKKSTVLEPNIIFIDSFSVVILIVATLYIIRSLPQLRELSFGDMTSVVSAYVEYRAESEADQEYGLLAALHGVCRFFYAFLLFYHLSSKKRTRFIYIIVFSLAIVISVLLGFSHGVRGPMLALSFQIIAALVLFWNRYSMGTRGVVKRMMLVFSGIIVITFSIITLARFSSDKKSVGEEVVYYAKSYAAQSMLNFNENGLDNGGLRYGDKTFPIVRKALGLQYSKSYMERRGRFWYLKMDDSVFYTFVGDFTLDYGPFVAFILFILFLFYYVIFFKRVGPISLGQIIVAYIIFIKCSAGFTLYPFAEMGGNRALIFMLFIAVVFDFDVMIRSSKARNKRIGPRKD